MALNQSNPSKINSPIAPSEIETLLNNAKPHEHVASLLNIHGFSTNISNLSLNLNLKSGLDFTGCQFTNVTVSGSVNGAQFNYVDFNKVNFDKADLTQATFNHSHFNQSDFSHVHLNQVSFIDSSLEKSSLIDCDMSDSSFYQTQINDTVMAQPNLHNVLDLDNSLNQVHIVIKSESDTSDYAMTNAHFHVAQANVASTDDGEWAMDAHNDIAGAGAKIKEFGDDSLNEFLSLNPSEQKLNFHDLCGEIQLAIAKADKSHPSLSIAQQVLQSELPNIQIMKHFVQETVKDVDSVFIPGGEDIISEFYGKADGNALMFRLYDLWSSPEDYVQGATSVKDLIFAKQFVEFALIDHAMDVGKPVMGVCHGLQIMNVFFGGSIKSVAGHNGYYQPLDIHADQGILGSELKPGMLGPSFHSQAIDKLGHGLEVVATYDNVIKGAQAINGAPVIMTQFHPEHRVDDASKAIMQKFIDLSTDQAVERHVLDIKEVLGIEDNNLIALMETPAAQSLPQVADVATTENHTLFIPTLEQALYHEHDLAFA